MYSYKIENLNFQYPTRENLALKNISLEIKKGEFVLLFGLSGCGKSTLLKHFKSILTPYGKNSGKIYFEDKILKDVEQSIQVSKIGYVSQNPDNQIVTDKVWHELSFGLESLGMGTDEIRLKVAEMASFFGIQNWFHKNVEELSGGQKQLLNLASIMVMNPSVLILDEPTAQLDPIATKDFFETLKRINTEFGITIILSEQRLEEVFPIVDRAILIEDGKILLDEEDTRRIAMSLKRINHPMYYALPTPARLFCDIHRFDKVDDSEDKIPLTIKDGRDWFLSYAKKNSFSQLEKDDKKIDTKPIIIAKDLWFRYEKDLPDIVKNLSFEIKNNEIFSIMGGNGTGKSTTLSLLCGLNTAYNGKVIIDGRDLANISQKDRYNKLIGVLPQNPQILFVKKTLYEDLLDVINNKKITDQEKHSIIMEIAKICDIENLLQYHPYDLSGGEQQRAGLAKVLLLEPKILFLDEPTKGLDGYFKVKFADILNRLKGDGKTIVMISHDIEFCAKYSDRVAMFFDGDIVSINTPRAFFSGNNYYTTASNRIARDLEPFAITEKDILNLFGKKNDVDDIEYESIDKANLGNKKLDNKELYKKNIILNKAPSCEKAKNIKSSSKSANDNLKKNNSNSLDNGKFNKAKNTQNSIGTSNIGASDKNYNKTIINSDGDFDKNSIDTTGIRKPNKREKTIAIVALIFLALTQYFFNGKFTDYKQYIVHGFMFLEIIVILGNLFPQSEIYLPNYSGEISEKKFSKRTMVAIFIILIIIPLTIYFGIYYLNDRKYYFISTLIIFETMIPFAMIFESRNPKAKELVVISVLIAIAVAGRSAFFMLPHFKPIAAIAIIAGVCLGAEAGFLTGSATMFVSNIFFGQGPWTPWQMFAMGILGFLAGILFKKRILKKHKLNLAIFGALVTFFIYGGIMNPASVLMFQPNPSKGAFLFAYAQGVPVDLIHAFSTAIFLWFLSYPMIEKLERTKIKYGLLSD